MPWGDVTQYQGGLDADTGRGPSANIWGAAPVSQAGADPAYGIEVFEDFHLLPFTTLPTTEGAWGLYKVFSSSGGTFNAADEDGGVRTLGEVTDNEGVHFGMASFPFKIIRGGTKLLFEARVKRANITGTHGFVVGLIDSRALTATVPITAAGALADMNFVGFHNLEGDPSHVDTVYKADTVTAVTVQADAVTLVADTYVKLGMIWEPKTNLLTYLKDGVALATTKTVPAAAGTDFPNDVRLGFVIGALNGATAALSVSIDWFRVFQYAA